MPPVEHHDSITKLPESHAKTVSSILKLIENNIPVYISCPTMKQNKSDFREVLEWANNHKISANTDYSIMAEYDHCADNLCHRLSPKECGEVISDIVEFDQDYQREILQVGFVKRIKEFQVNPDSRFCGVGISTCCMSSTGLVFPCPSWQSYICGNLNENSLIDIWENSQKLNHLRGIKRKDIPKCIDCENAAFCSPCFARNANESLDGNMLEVNEYFCDVAAMNKEIVFNYIKNHKKQDNM